MNAKSEQKRLPNLVWGVFKQDCYKFTRAMVVENLIKRFENFKEALEFSNQYPNSAIHLTDEA